MVELLSLALDHFTADYVIPALYLLAASFLLASTT